MIALAIGAILLLGLATRHQIPYWTDSVSLWTHTIEATGENSIAELNLGGLYEERGQWQAALPHLRKAAALRPSDCIVQVDLAVYEEAVGHFTQAINQFNLIVQEDPRCRDVALSNIAAIEGALDRGAKPR